MNEWKPELSQEVLAGINAAIHAERDLEQIDAAIAATNNGLATAKTAMDAAREALAGAEAKAALEGGGADKPARRALLVARDDHEFLTARLEGLQARRNAAADTLARARHGAAVSYRTWQRQQAQYFAENVYLPAMEQFVAVIRMAVGAGSALESHMLTAIGRDTVLRNPADWERNPASARRTGWQTDPLYLRLTELAALVRPHLGQEFTQRTQEDSGAATDCGGHAARERRSDVREEAVGQYRGGRRARPPWREANLRAVRRHGFRSRQTARPAAAAVRDRGHGSGADGVLPARACGRHTTLGARAPTREIGGEDHEPRVQR